MSLLISLTKSKIILNRQNLLIFWIDPLWQIGWSIGLKDFISLSSFNPQIHHWIHHQIHKILHSIHFHNNQIHHTNSPWIHHHILYDITIDICFQHNCIWAVANSTATSKSCKSCLPPYPTRQFFLINPIPRNIEVSQIN